MSAMSSWAQQVKDYAFLPVIVPVIAAVITSGATVYATSRGSSDKNREMDIKMLELSLAILREDPEKSQIKAARGWAVDLINHVSPMPIPKDARAQLISNKLPIAGLTWSEQLLLHMGSKEMLDNAAKELRDLPEGKRDRSCQIHRFGFT